MATIAADQDVDTNQAAGVFPDSDHSSWRAVKGAGDFTFALDMA
jgi:hypothetical protein